MECLPKLPLGVRSIIYSFMPVSELMKVISKISKKDREILVTSLNIDQPRNIRITNSNLIKNASNLKYIIQLVNGYIIL